MSVETLNLTVQPIQIGSVTIPNRIVRTAHFTAFAFGAVNDDLIAYHLARAKGGVGLTILEACAIHPSSMLGLSSFDDSVIEPTTRLVEAVRPYGMKVFLQLFHGGHHYPPPGGIPTRGVSALPSPVDGFPAVPLTGADIAELVESYVAAARRAVTAGIDGIDGIEIHAGHGYLPQQFISEITNDRQDEYGGSLPNRTRFLREVLEAVRAAVPGTPVGARFSAGQDADSERDIEAAVTLLLDAGLLDFVDISMGDYYSTGREFAPGMMLGGTDREAGYQGRYAHPLV